MNLMLDDYRFRCENGLASALLLASLCYAFIGATHTSQRLAVRVALGGSSNTDFSPSQPLLAELDCCRTTDRGFTAGPPSTRASNRCRRQVRSRRAGTGVLAWIFVWNHMVRRRVLLGICHDEAVRWTQCCGRNRNSAFVLLVSGLVPRSVRIIDFPVGAALGHSLAPAVRAFPLGGNRAGTYPAKRIPLGPSRDHPGR